MNLKPNWINQNTQFWFERYSEVNGQEFQLVTLATGVKSALFSKVKLEQALDENLSLNWLESPLSKVSFDGAKLAFTANNKRFSCQILANVYRCDLSVDSQDSIDKKPDYLSPNKKFYVKVENYNLILCQVKNNSCKTLTNDGTEQTPYAVTHPYPEKKLADKNFDPQNQLGVYWSADSRYLITYKLFRAGVTKLTMTDSTADKYYAVNTVEYYYPQAGDKVLPHAQPVLVDASKQQAQLLDIPPVMQTYYGQSLWGEWQNNDFYYLDRRRGNREMYLRKVDAEKGKVISLIKETDKEYVDPWVQDYQYLPELNQVIWSSQRTGYQHLYLYDAETGEFKNAITQGEFTVRAIKAVDEQKGILYFEASGKESGRDPYLRHLYRINLDGSNLVLLTPEAFEHNTYISPDYQFFIDNYSDVQTPTTSWLRSTSDGKKIAKLDQANVNELTALGWQPPEPFSVLADDGATPLYGLIYKPTNFDTSNKYPVINDTYTGPHNFFTPKSFKTFNNQRPALAELGFIVIKMDGRGTNKRGRVFHRNSFKNLAAGTDDHVWAIKQLAKKHDYLDINRVGIFGFSAGGYDTMQAMLRHNGFFKAGVSASGNHDFRVDKAGWNEIWMGWPVTEHWQQQSNYTDVERLQGKLLLAHGELDSNVHPSATLRLVEKLIEANKDFDLLMMPKMGHVLDRSPYFVEKRWQFFTEHLNP